MSWPTSDVFSLPARVLHWLMAILILAMVFIGIGMVSTVSDRHNWLLSLHKPLGITILVLACIRLVWRLRHPPPPLPGDLPRMQRLAAIASHWLLYALMFALPLSGWLFNSTAGYPLQYFGLFNLPKLAARNEELAQLTRTLHETGFWVLLALVLAHAAAAFYHHLFQNDATLTRMLPGGHRTYDAIADAANGHGPSSADDRSQLPPTHPPTASAPASPENRNAP